MSFEAPGSELRALHGTSWHAAFLVRKTPSLADPPDEAGLTHLAPKLMAQIAFEEWTADRKLRQPVFLGLRDDKEPKDYRVEQPVEVCR